MRAGRRHLLALAVVVGAAVCTHGDLARGAGVLRVCADPNNLPFSNHRRQGFENRLAEMVAADAGMRVHYAWWPQRRGFLRNTLDSGVCDVVMGLPAGYGGVRTTTAYYRSMYVMVSQEGRLPGLTSLDDPRLRSLRIGVQMIGDDFANSPPAHAMSMRGLTQNIVGYSVLGDYSQPDPPARIVGAVARGDVDAAVVWGPLAGYFAARQPVALALAPVTPPPDAALPFAFDISMAVRASDSARQQVLDEFIRRHQAQIDALLAAYGVPRGDGSRGDRSAGGPRE